MRLFTPIWLPLLALTAAGFAPSAAKAQAAATETRAVAEFQAVSVAGSIDLEVRQGDRHSVQVRAAPEVLPLVETVVDGSGEAATLLVRIKRGTSMRDAGPIGVQVVVPRLTAVASAGSGNVRIESLTTPKLELRLSGSGGAEVAGLATESLALKLSGSSDFKGSGKATRLQIAIAGSGDVRAAGLSADEVSIRIAGSGDAAVLANRTLSVSIAGSGSVVYSGDAAVTSSVAGSGSVKKR